MAAGPLEAVIEDFESGGTAGAVAVDASNSSAGGASNSALSNVADAGSLRLKMQDGDGTYNGAVITIPGAIPMAGYYLITADVKVDNSTAPIGSFGMAAVAGGPVTTRVLDTSAGYVMNLTGNNDGSLGYQTIGAQVQVPEGGTFPQDLTLYFSSDVSGNPNGPAADGDFNRVHRASATVSWAAGNTNSVYIDNIKRIGPGNIGEERHLWISVGDAYTNLSTLDNLLVSAKQNNFNVIDILARYRSDAYYVPNRTNATYPNPEPMGTKVAGGAVTTTNDPLQYAIDRGHELGLKVYISFSCFLATDTATYPAYLPSGSVQWFYNSGAPRAMVSADAGNEGLWSDPSRKDVRDHTKNVLMDIVSNYDVDGIMFDRVRYPGQNFSYNPTGLSQLASTYGLPISPLPTPTSAAFRDARREVIATFLQDCYTSITTAKPWIVVGSTPVCTLDNMVDTYNQYFQYWPKWTSKKAPNRTISFGILDMMQPQFYRLFNSTAPYQAPASNQRLMDKAIYGDTATLSSDMGLMPGSNISLTPLFYHPNSADAGQSAANSQNAVDTRTRKLSGFGFFNATKTLPDISMVRSTGNNTAGVDILAQPSATTDYLQKANFDNVAPNGATNLAAVANANGTVSLTWTAPVPAVDGDGAANYFVYRSTTTPVKEYYSNLLTKSGVSGAATGYTVPAGVTGSYYYKVVAVDDYNNHGPSATKGPIAVNGTALSPADVIVDNPQATWTPSIAAWAIGTSSTDKFGADYRSNGKGTGSETAVFTGAIPQDGSWDVWEWHPAGTNRTTGAPHAINNAGATINTSVNQQVNGGKWNKIGTANFNGGTNYSVVLNDNFSNPLTGQVIMADAIRWSYVSQLAGTPSAPGGLSAVGYGSTTINLTWFDNANNETGYQVLRAQVSGGAYTVIANLPADSTSYSDLNLPGGNYYYVVRAINAAGKSVYSNESWAHVPVPAPSAPVGLAASNTGCTTNHLTWQPTAEIGAATDQYVLRAMSEEGPYTPIAQIAPLDGMFDDIGLLNGSTYFYKVIAANGDVTSTESNSATASTPALPAVPGDVSGAAVSQTEISLTWQDNATNEDGYEVVRDGNVVAQLPIDSTSYTESGLTADTAYSYSVHATSPCGPSSDSQAISVTTLPNPPDAPSDLAAAPVTGVAQVNLTWTDNATNETGFEVVRNGSVIATLSADSNSYSDSAAPQCDTLTYSVRAFNTGGKSAASNEASLSIDVTNPTITAPADVTVGTDAGQSYATGVALGSAATGDNCGVASVSSDAPSQFALGSTTVTWTVTDGKGNSATAQQIVIVEDREDPVVTCPSTINVGASVDALVPVTCSPLASDNVPGVTVVCNPPSGSGFPVGTTTVNVTATDAAGNTATCSFDVVRAGLGFTGFLSPIGGSVDQGTGGSYAAPVKIFKLGSTIPVKMTINLDGAAVSSGIHKLQAIKYDSAAAPGAPIDATPTDAATTGNQFRVTNAGSGEWHFNLSSKSGFAQGTWKLVATLSDGSTHEVWIDLK